MTERDDFDKIVEGLELDLSFVDQPQEPAVEPEPEWSPTTDDEVQRLLHANDRPSPPTAMPATLDLSAIPNAGVSR